MTLQLRPDVATVCTEHGTVLLDEHSGRYWQLNATGTHILHALLAGEHSAQIATDLAARHHQPAEQVRGEVATIIDQLRTANLVVAR